MSAIGSATGDLILHHVELLCQGTPEENAKLDQSYEHLCKMRDELVTLNIVPPISEWNKINPNL